MDLPTHISHEAGSSDITFVLFAHCKISFIIDNRFNKSVNMNNLYFCSILSNRWNCRCRCFTELMTINITVVQLHLNPAWMLSENTTLQNQRTLFLYKMYIHELHTNNYVWKHKMWLFVYLMGSEYKLINHSGCYLSSIHAL